MVVGHELRTPDTIQEAGPGHDHAGIAHECREQVELRRGQGDRRSIDAHFAAARVEGQTGWQRPLTGARGARPPQESLDPGDEFARTERLDEVVIRSDRESYDAIYLLA